MQSLNGPFHVSQPRPLGCWGFCAALMRPPMCIADKNRVEHTFCICFGDSPLLFKGPRVVLPPTDMNESDYNSTARYLVTCTWHMLYLPHRI